MADRIKGTEHFAHFEVDITPIGRGSKIIVNGEDVSNRVSAFAVHASSSPAEATVLQLFMYADGKIEGDGIVEAYKEDNAQIADFLKGVDRSQLEAAALERGGWSGTGQGTLVDHVVETLLEMLEKK
jgi:hypothetical protein